MSKSHYKGMLQKELQAINNKIDRLILRGKPYLKEAREHSRIRALITKHA